MPVSQSLAILRAIYWNSYTLSFQHDSPIPLTVQQLFGKPPKLLGYNIQLKGQTILITGANSGVGLETARKCVQFGAERIIFGVRNLAKGEAAKKRYWRGNMTRCSRRR
jgi:NADPH:quinone reductase-like Zn-dependent oxidoreductase